VTRKGLVWRPGGVKLGHGEASEPIAVQHCRCLRHGHFLDYPSFLVPRKHYAAEVVESALSARAQGRTLEEICSVQGLPDTSAVRRWVRDVMVRIPVLLVDVRKRSIKWLAGVRDALHEATTLTPPSFYRVWSLLQGQQRASPDLLRRFPTVSHLALSV